MGMGITYFHPIGTGGPWRIPDQPLHLRSPPPCSDPPASESAHTPLPTSSFPQDSALWPSMERTQLRWDFHSEPIAGLRRIFQRRAPHCIFKIPVCCDKWGTEGEDEASRRELRLPTLLPQPSAFTSQADSSLPPTAIPAGRLPQTGKCENRRWGGGCKKSGGRQQTGRFFPPSFQSRHLARSLVVRSAGGGVWWRSFVTISGCRIRKRNSGWDTVSPASASEMGLG